MSMIEKLKQRGLIQRIAKAAEVSSYIYTQQAFLHRPEADQMFIDYIFNIGWKEIETRVGEIEVMLTGMQKYLDEPEKKQQVKVELSDE